MALTADTPRTWALGDIEEYPLAASEVAFEGAAIGENGSGYARALQAGDVFLGFADRPSDNAAGGTGARAVRVRARGRVTLPIAGLAVTANDRPAVYASDDGTFTLTATSNSLIGYVSRWVATGQAVVEFDAGLVRAALQA